MTNERKPAVPYEQLQGRQIAAAQTNLGALASIEESRALMAAQSRVILAKRFPRDEEVSRNKILKAFENPKLADAALYSYPRGDTTVEDLSIRAAETMANYWGNMEYGIQEIDRGAGYSEMLAYCWDLESNVYHYRAFKARHWRDTRTGGYAVKDERDIYEVTFNLGARRLRSCILECLPAHIKEEAESVINESLAKAEGSVPIQQRVATMLDNFGKEYNVTRDMIERRLGHSLSAVSETEMVGLRKVFKTLKDGQAKAEDFFPPVDDAPKPAAQQKPKPAEREAEKRPPEREQPKPAEQSVAQEDAGGAPDPNAHKTADEARAAAAAAEEKPPTQREQIDASLDRLEQEQREQQAPAKESAKEKEKPKPKEPAGKAYTGDPLSGGEQTGLEPLDFTQAFTAIVQAKTVEDLDVIRTRTKHLNEKQRANLGVSIDNKVKALSAKSASLE